MSRVLLASVPLGFFTDRYGNSRAGVAVTITYADGSAAPLYSAATGTTTVAATTDSNGYLPGYLEPGTYTFAADGQSHVAEVVSASQMVPVGNGVASDRARLVAAIAALPATGGDIRLGRGTYVVDAAITTLKNGTRIVGEGPSATIIKFTGSSGYCFDIQAVGKVRLEGLSIDGTSATGTGCALRLGSGTSRNEVHRVLVWNFTGNSNAYTTELQGSLDNTFTLCDWENNGNHLRLRDNGAVVSPSTYPSNQNNFYSCKFQTAQQAAGSAIVVQDSEGNVFHGCLIQNNKSINTVAVLNTSGGNAPGRGNVFDSCWLEENGNTQAGSHGFHIAGYDSGHPIEGTVIRSCKLLSSAQNSPGSQIYTTNAKATVIDANYANLGTPNKSIEAGAGSTTPVVQPTNDLAGDISMSSSDVPTVASATATTLPSYGRVIKVSGTTTITSITASWPGRRVTLIFTGILTLTDGSNLKLSANFVTSADDAITLVCDGSSWYADGAGSAN